MARIRVLIVDDHPVVRAGIEGMLASQADLEIVGQAADGASAIDLCEELHPAVVLMDLRMAGMDGVTATRAIKGRFPAIQVLVLTTYDSDADILRAIEAG
ncbi:MAG: response regulator transcription factor, partial [Caldilineaceae bacterium]|nr:response regulator transcription factor [Caldilineaceae bacterium]